MPDLATSSFPALGTNAVVLTRSAKLIRAVHEVQRELETIDRACSRFREDSDLSRLNGAQGAWTEVSERLFEAVGIALRAASVTDGLVDPTMGEAMQAIGYDRDFADVAPAGPALSPPPSWIPMADWRRVELRRRTREIRIPRGTRLDLGSTAKALAADRAAVRAAGVTGCGVLVSLGGDIALCGRGPGDGWPVRVGDDHRRGDGEGTTICLREGGLATSSTTVRRWRSGGDVRHHILDPRRGAPAAEVWRTVSVAAGNCVDANIASTAAIVRGERAVEWLEGAGLPARLVSAEGAVVHLAGWPEPIR